MSEHYKIVVPSRGRPHNMKRILQLFPAAYICVADNEADAYLAAGVRKERLLVRPDMPLIETRNWIFDHVDAPCIVQFNDDVRALKWFALPQRTIRDHRQISAVIEQTLQMSADLDIGVFTWAMHVNPVLLRPEARPFRAAAPVSAHAFGVRGRARDRRFDPFFVGMGDYEYTFRTLAEDRLVLGDMRYAFDCGRMSSGVGGNTGRFSKEAYHAAREELRRRYGRYMRLGGAGRKYQAGARMAVNVPRTQPHGLT